MNRGIPVVPVFHHFVKILDLIFTQRSITLDGQPRRRIDTCLEFHASTVGILDICCQIFADITHSTSLHKLVGIIHIEEVHTQAPDVVVVGIAQFVIHQLLSLREGIGSIICKVITLRFTMTHGYRTIDTMTIQIPRKASLRIQEVIFLMDVERLVIISALVIIELIIDTICLIIHMTILDIGKHIPLL